MIKTVVMEKKRFEEKYNGKATYQITVSGKVDPYFINNHHEFEVVHSELEDRFHSRLTGEIKNQESLIEVLNFLFDYQYEVISVMKVDS